MTREDLQQDLAGRFPDFTFEEGGQFLTMHVPAAQWSNVAYFFRDTPEMQFDFLFCFHFENQIVSNRRSVGDFWW
mgnify:CR=1 FL=1